MRKNCTNLIAASGLFDEYRKLAMVDSFSMYRRNV
jgi:hypothetical protein